MVVRVTLNLDALPWHERETVEERAVGTGAGDGKHSAVTVLKLHMES